MTAAWPFGDDIEDTDEPDAADEYLNLALAAAWNRVGDLIEDRLDNDPHAGCYLPHVRSGEYYDCDGRAL